MDEDLSLQIQHLKRILLRARRIAFLGGAGTSTESGIPDFRSGDGLFAAKHEFGHRPETILSRSFFDSHPEEFFAYYRKYLLYPNAKPNNAHKALACLEQNGKIGAVITQNIDGLHQKAGSKRVVELHGSVLTNHCVKCGRAFSLTDILKKTNVPLCGCGGVIKPDVVLYEEPLDQSVLSAAVTQISRADTLIIGGTSLAVYPAAGLIDFFHGDNLVVINRSRTSRDVCSNLAIAAPIGEVLRQAVLEPRLFPCA